jgi:ssRNA-specific RNase YbeY (16S rRNA maturation enzyme)
MAILSIRNRCRSFAVRERGLRRYFACLARALGLSPRSAVDVTLAGDGAMRRLKRAHFGREASTDVIAFPTDFGPFDGGIRYLGELVLCPVVIERNGTRAKRAPVRNGTRAKRAPVRNGRPMSAAGRRSNCGPGFGGPGALDREALFVFTHGVLHLLGWDDSTPRRRARMFARQRALLGRCAGPERIMMRRDREVRR